MESLRSPGALVLAGLALMLGAGTCGFADGVEETAEHLAISSIGVQLGLGAIALAGAAFSRRGTSARLGLGAGRLEPRVVAVLVLGTVALSHGVDAVLHLTELRGESALADLEAELVGARGRVLLASLVGVGVAPGFGEELFCRGLVQRGLVWRVGPRVGIVVAAVFFGALHGEPIHGAAAAMLGLYLGTIAWMADSIRASIACHVANNLAAVSVVALSWEIAVTPVYVVVSMGLAGWALWWAWRRTGPPDIPDPPKPRDAVTEEFARD